MSLPAHRPAVSAPDQSLDRRVRMLRTAMGPEIAAALEDPEVVEVLLNPDGTLWLDRLGSGRAPTGGFDSPGHSRFTLRAGLGL